MKEQRFSANDGIDLQMQAQNKIQGGMADALSPTRHSASALKTLDIELDALAALRAALASSSLGTQVERAIQALAATRQQVLDGRTQARTQVRHRGFDMEAGVEHEAIAWILADPAAANARAFKVSYGLVA